jgi:hypothetical protein
MVDYERLMEEDGPDPATVLADRGKDGDATRRDLERRAAPIR